MMKIAPEENQSDSPPNFQLRKRKEMEEDDGGAEPRGTKRAAVSRLPRDDSGEDSGPGAENDHLTKGGTEPELEFGSPRAIIVTIVLMPLLVFTINAACNKTQCTVLAWPEWPQFLSQYLDPTCFKLYWGWILFHVLAYYLVPGKVVRGQPTPSGKRLAYKCNGWRVLLLVVGLFGLAVLSGVRVHLLYDKLFGLMTAATLTAVVLSVFLYHRAPDIPKDERSECGNTGHGWYDFYLGRELNPRLGRLDLKYVCELRPGLLGWLVLNLMYLGRALHTQGSVPLPQLAVTLGHAVYVIDALYYEESVLTTLDITREGFGFMLAFGDLVWVPFLFSLQARFLLEHPQTWSRSTIALVMSINAVGYWIFRSSNNEKDLFRREPNHPAFINKRTLTAPGGRSLLVAGWWGLCRHPNYLGDLLMALAWTLPCGLGHFLPWFYPLYLLGTLIHRSGRDDRSCARKYGSTWDQYCRLVPYRIVPGIF